MRRPVVLRSALVGVAALAFGVVPTIEDGSLLTAPVMCAEGDVTPDGRVFPEPIASVTYLGFAEFECGIELLAERHPDRLRIDELLPEDAGATEPLYDVVMSDFTVDGPKEELLVISSIHGNEIGPREGAARQIEDLLEGHAFTDIDMDQLDVDRLLAEFEIHWVFPNPQGWVRGEPGSNIVGTYSRGETDAGRDLNRNFPVQGYFAYQQQDYFQPEGDAVRELFTDVRDAEAAGTSGGWDLGTDNHGQLYDTYLAAGLQIVGQFDFQKSERLATFADRIDDEMANYMSTAAFAELQLALQEQGRDIAGGYRWGTLYDILGYSASGSGIDYYNTPGEVDGVGFATELTISNQPATNQVMYSGAATQVWVDSIRAINTAMFKEALAENDGEREFTFELAGDVAYVFDDARITHDDANGRGNTVDAQNPGGHELQPYDVSKYDFFVDLDAAADHDVVPVPAHELATTDLSRFEAVVLTETEVLDRLGVRDEGVAALTEYAKAGGKLLLTDSALQVMEDLSAIQVARVAKEYVGAVDAFEGNPNGLNDDLRGIASQTFDTVPIGYAFGGSNNSAPNWTLARSSWEADGGVTAGTTNGDTIYGELPFGTGVIRVLGALLPDPTEEFYHPFGLQDYAVTYTGYTLLQNMVNADMPFPTEG